MKGLLLDISYASDEDKTTTRLYVKTAKGTQVMEDTSFDPYFYLLTKDPREALKIDGVKEVQVLDKNTLKVICNTPADVPKVREKARKFGHIREFDIPFTQRYLIDHDIQPMEVYDWKGTQAKKAEGDIKLKRIAFDFETYNPKGYSLGEKDPILLASAHDGKKGTVFSWKKITGAKDYASEKEMLEAFIGHMRSADIVYSYNGDNFDLPYLRDRRKALKIKEGLGHDGKPTRFRNAMRGVSARIPGKAHLDAYQGISFLAYIGALRLPRYTLEDVYKELTGKDKLDIDSRDIHKRWDTGKGLKELVQYNLEDAEAAWELGEYLLPLYTELAKLVGAPIADVSRMTTGQMVELLLLKRSFKRGVIAPNKPGKGELAARIQKPITGGFVKTPESGLHEDLAVLDFRGLYPSIIISHNISPETLDCKCCKDPHTSPQGHKFCKKRKGLVPEMLEELINRRIEVKKRMKKASGAEKKRLHAEQWALKIVANSTYGYTLYARARWFSRQCGESITAWARHYVQDLIASAEKKGFKVLYGDTDSAFLKLGKKKKSDVEKFIDDYNSTLPEAMEVEFEGYYPRGIFVTKKEGGAAKKRYALLREDGQVEITGLEFVRRDWSALAKKTQREVVKAVLENRVDDAKKIVMTTIDKVRANDVPINDLVIYTQLKRKIEKYEAVGPHVRAAMRLEESGEDVTTGMTVGYIVTKGAGNIGDRSYPIELVGKRSPDAEYYVDHQVLPAVMKILAELGIEEDELKHGSKQTGLEAWS